MQVPILGALFRSRDYINNQTELVVIVTPYVVRAVAQKNCRGRTTASPIRATRARVLLGKLNRIYGGTEAARPVAAQDVLTAITASFSIDRPQERHDGSLPNSAAREAPRSGAARRLLAAARCSAWPVATRRAKPTTRSIRDDYRERHPITLREGERTVEVFVGRNRGGLSPAQRADVVAFAQTGSTMRPSGILIDVPRGERDQAGGARFAARDPFDLRTPAACPRTACACAAIMSADFALAEHQAQLLRADGDTPARAACGRTTSARPTDPVYHQNRPYWNLGCAHQRNLAAMVDNPADLVQPRGETPAYTEPPLRRDRQISQGRKPERTYPADGTTATTLGKISDLGK